MKKLFGKKILAVLVALVMVLALVPAIALAAPDTDSIVILYTNDVHGGINDGAKYAGVAGLKDAMELEYDNVFLVDAGDAVQGSPYASLTLGEVVIEVMNEVGYNVMALGNHEFDYGLPQLLNLRDMANFPMLSDNFTDLNTGLTVSGFGKYEILTATNGKKVAIVGLTTPEAMTKASPAAFQDGSGNWIYDFNNADIAATTQPTIDYVRGSEGADYVIVLGHLGVDLQSFPWRSTDFIANIEGVDAFIDGHSHTVRAGGTVSDKNGDPVVLTQTGTKLANIGKLIIAADGTITTALVKAADVPQSAAVQTFVDGKLAALDPILNAKVASSDVKLTVNFEAGDSRPYAGAVGSRAVRKVGTNLGDLCADAYIDLFERLYDGADIAFVNGGGVRENILPGDILLSDIIKVHPFNNTACLIEVTGQEILDALEFGTMMAPFAESGGFPQVSGVTFEVHSYIPSSVVLDPGAGNAFVRVDGEYRVKNVMVGGVPLVLTQTYTLAGHNFMLKDGGDGYSMFKGNTVLLDQVMVDNEVLSSYIVETLGGNISATSIYAKPEGEGRITFITDPDHWYIAPEEIAQVGDLVEYVITLTDLTADMLLGYFGIELLYDSSKLLVRAIDTAFTGGELLYNLAIADEIRAHFESATGIALAIDADGTAPVLTITFEVLNTAVPGDVLPIEFRVLPNGDLGLYDKTTLAELYPLWYVQNGSITIILTLPCGCTCEECLEAGECDGSCDCGCSLPCGCHCEDCMAPGADPCDGSCDCGCGYADKEDLLAAILEALAFMDSDAFDKLSKELQDLWIATVGAGIESYLNHDATQKEVDDATDAINRLKKTGETEIIFAVAGVLLLAVAGLAYVSLRRRRYN
ncbi:MAG: 5'-nucleotidase C-terminal domain-containing protein [Clostridiales bacterium]|nr:5'-nucleotidase C-terminal domain-containing protein [Clostridiales bacterium]